MLNKGIRKYMSNPAIGLMPFLLFIVLHTCEVGDFISLSIGFVVAVVGEIFIRNFYKTRGLSLLFYVSGISLGLTIIIWLFSNEYVWRTNTYVVICEVIVVIMFMLMRGSRTFIGAYFFRQKNLLQKALLNELYDSSTLIQFGLTLHVFGILLYRQFTPNHPELKLLADIIVFSVIPIAIILAVSAYQLFKINSMVSKLKKEEWLPIVTEKGEVTGKIAKSISINMKNKFLHPVVRVALVSDSKVFMQERPLNDILNPGKLDYPFEKYMLFNHEINLAARNSLRRMIGDDLDVSISFLVKYVFENNDTKRLIFLFVAQLDDETKVKRSNKITGKFWTIKQLEEGFADEIFSECFELEFEYLKNMVLQPKDILKKVDN